MGARSTHRDLAQCLNDIADKLEKLPPCYLVSDGGTLSCIRGAAASLVRQDARIGELTVSLREAKYGKTQSNDAA